MKKLLITALTVMMFHACATKTVVCADDAKAQLYVDSHNNMSAVYLDKTPYYLFIEAGTGKYIYRAVPYWRIGYLEKIHGIEIELK